ncbi:hypothetical protein [Salinivibrio costicola]|uniref:hypothetical protein n=1 Tax=Salinivibrio costicola TaxID=51367 RepID=UPI000395E2E8|nr:hypothetical protein [Salinivibrio costicola]
MTDSTQQKLQALLKQCNADKETRKRVADSIKKLGLDRQPPISLRKSLHLTPANIHTLDVKLAKIADEVTQLQVVTSTTLSHAQLFTVSQVIGSHGWELLSTDAAEVNINFFVNRK